MAVSTSGLLVSFSSSTLSVCTASGSTLTLVAVGTCTVTANQPGNATYAAAAPVSNSFAVAGTAQTITFASPGPQTVGTPVPLVGTSTSGLTVSFSSSTPSVCTVSGTTLTPLAVGTCTVNANQAGNATYAPAAEVSNSFTVAAAAVEFLANGGFEVAKTAPAADPTQAKGWLGSPHYNRDCTVSHSGGCSARLESPAFNADGAEQNNAKDGLMTTLTLGTTPTMTFWAKGVAGATGDFKARLAYLDGVGNVKYDSNFVSFGSQLSTSTWKQFSLPGGVVPQSGLAAFVQFYQPIGPIGIGPAGEDWFKGQVYVDDVSLQVKP